MTFGLFVATQAIPAWASIVPGQVDDFQDGSVQGWQAGGFANPNGPINVSSGGPAGIDDSFLRLTSTGSFGAGGKLVAFNFDQWTGDYLGSGIRSIQMQVNNLGTTNLVLRLILEDGFDGQSLTTVSPVNVPAGSGWNTVSFPVSSTNLTGGVYGTVMSSVTTLNLVHSPNIIAARSGAPTIAAQLGVDNVTAAPFAQVADRRVFYNTSSFDLSGPGAGPGDDAAIASDKAALLPGGTATLANYTNYSRGINGVMIDVFNLAGTPTAADFEFRVGNNNDSASWSVLADLPAVSVREGAGVDGSDRITLLWPDNVVEQRWLRVMLKSTAATGLADPDVFYLGNAIGEAGNSATDLQVNAADQLISRGHPTNLASALRLISVPFGGAVVPDPLQVPEPSALYLAGLALTAFAVVVARRRRRSQCRFQRNATTRGIRDERMPMANSF